MKMIVACDKKNGIGKNNGIPWKCVEDLAYFKRVTTDGLVVMGRKTWDSLRRPLKTRVNVVLTKNRVTGADYVCRSVEETLDLVRRFDKDVFVIGGSEIYKLFLEYTSVIYKTVIPVDGECDTFFPETPGFVLSERVIGESCTFETYTRG